MAKRSLNGADQPQPHKKHATSHEVPLSGAEKARTLSLAAFVSNFFYEAVISDNDKISDIAYDSSYAKDVVQECVSAQPSCDGQMSD
jgi:hypothetical protein